MSETTQTAPASTRIQEKLSEPQSRHDPQRVAEERLAASSYLALRSISCEHHEGVLVIHGRVPSFYLKQIAQTLVRDLDGVELVVNRLSVDKPPPGPP